MEIYSDIILSHNSKPFHFEKKTELPIILEAYNSLCGDKFKIFLNIENEIISEIYFYGYGCAISKAATSVLMKKIFQKKIFEAKKIIENYFIILESNFEKNIPENNFEKNFEKKILKKKFEKNPEENFEKNISLSNIFFDEEILAFNAVREFPERKTCATLSWEVVRILLLK